MLFAGPLSRRSFLGAAAMFPVMGTASVKAQPQVQPPAADGQSRVERSCADRTMTLADVGGPTLDPDSAARLHAAIDRLDREPASPVSAIASPKALRVGGTGADVETFRLFLVREGDLDARFSRGPAYDADLIAAVRRYQARHGLKTTGQVGPRTWTVMTRPQAARRATLVANLRRIQAVRISPRPRAMLVNTAGAYVEAIENGRLAARYVAIVGKPERETPQLVDRVAAVTLNPTWTVPHSIVVRDLLPKLRRAPDFLAQSRMRILDRGREVPLNPRELTRLASGAALLRQDPGPFNALGNLRIEMARRSRYYLHGTSNPALFDRCERHLSSGCVRVRDVEGLAAWLLAGNAERIDRDSLLAELARHDGGGTPGRRVRLDAPVPIHWIYLTAWVGSDGRLQWRDDVYGEDDATA